jgi:predicted RNase H-like HicB family nuclease
MEDEWSHDLDQTRWGLTETGRDRVSPLWPSGIHARTFPSMKSYTAIIERDAETGLYVGYIPGWPGAHSQGATLEELQLNLREVVDMLLEDGEPRLESQFVGTQTLQIA